MLGVDPSERLHEVSLGAKIVADRGGFSAVPIIFFFVSSLIACDLSRSWQYTHIRPCPRHYGSSFGHRRVVASSTHLALFPSLLDERVASRHSSSIYTFD